LEEFVQAKIKELFPSPLANAGELVSQGVTEAKGFFSRLFGGGN